MSNKPVIGRQASDGYVLHDATDPNCQNHERAKRNKGIQPSYARVCPACAPVKAEYTDQPAKPKSRVRRKATRPAA